MAEQFMSVLWDTSTWRAAFQATTAKLRDMTPIMAAIGAHMEGSVKRTLQESGSPPGSFAAVIGGGGRPPLIAGDSGPSILAGIETAYTGPDRVEIASKGLRYSSVHQFGKTIRARNVPYLTFRLPSGQWVRKKEVTIPPRPFMVFRPEDPGKIAEIGARHLEAAFGGGLEIWRALLSGL